MTLREGVRKFKMGTLDFIGQNASPAKKWRDTHAGSVVFGKTDSEQQQCGPAALPLLSFLNRCVPQHDCHSILCAILPAYQALPANFLTPSTSEVPEQCRGSGGVREVRATRSVIANAYAARRAKATQSDPKATPKPKKGSNHRLDSGELHGVFQQGFLPSTHARTASLVIFSREDNRRAGSRGPATLSHH